MGAAHPIEATLEIERLIGSPSALYDVQILLRPLIALRLRREVTVAFLFGVSLSSDNMKREATSGQLIKGRDLASKKGWRHEPWPMCNKVCHPLGLCRRVHCDEKAFGGGR